MDARFSLLSAVLLMVATASAEAAPSELIADYYAETLAPTVSHSGARLIPTPSDTEGFDELSEVVQAGCRSGICQGSCGTGCDLQKRVAYRDCLGGCGVGTCCCSVNHCDRSSLLGFGLVKRSDRSFDDFISPMTNPVFFEDPRTLTEARFIFIHHELPDFLGANSVQVYALQVRVALSKRLSLIATKDGLIYTQSPVLESGYADIAAGLKYNLFHRPEQGWLASVGFTYEAPSGSTKSLQGNGDGVLNVFSSFGMRLGSKAHLISTRGIRTPLDDSAENSVFYWSNHLDHQIGNRPAYVFGELNWYNYLKSASAFPLPLEGGDLFNFGSPNVTGNDLVTGALGVKLKPKSNMELGVAWETPLTEREGILDHRFTMDWIVRY